MKQPAFMFYTGDWLKDPALSLCSPAARGIWTDLICGMHESGRSGELRGTREQLARVARCSTAELTRALTELQTTGAADVTERNGVVTVGNRRMKREAKARKQAALRVFRHRHPGEPPPCNGDDTPPSSSSDSLSPSGIQDPPTPQGGLMADGVVQVAWTNFLAMRLRIRKPATDRAKELLLAKLVKLADGDNGAAAAILDQSTLKSWQDLYPLKTEQSHGAHSQHSTPRQSQAERNARAAREAYADFLPAGSAEGPDD